MARSLLLVVCIAAYSVVSASVCVGCPEVVPQNAIVDTRYQDAANAGIALYNNLNDFPYATVLLEVTSGTQQIVAGVKYEFVVTAGVSPYCINLGDSPTSLECQVPETSRTQLRLVVWEKAWETPRYRLLGLTELQEGDKEEGENEGDHPLVDDPKQLNCRCSAFPSISLCMEELYTLILQGYTCKHEMPGGKEKEGDDGAEDGDKEDSGMEGKEGGQAQ